MKKLLCLLLACLLLALTGCGGSNTNVEPTEEPTATPEPTPEPTPAPSPVPKTAIADYEYYLASNSTLDVMFKYPSHWINQPGRSTIGYIEPVDPGETPARLAVTSKLMAERPELAMRLAVRGMLPRNIISKDALTRLKIFRGPDHIHAAQKPELWAAE